MSLLKTIFDLHTVKYRPNLQKRISEELLFEMPTIGMDPAIVLGFTRATALVAAAAYEAGHRRFLVLGGKEVDDEDPRFARILTDSLQRAGLPQPSNPKMKEWEYAREVLCDHFHIPSGNVLIRPGDTSTNFQQNMEAMGRGYSGLDSLEFYTLAGTARRVIGTARKVFDNNTSAIAAHNVYPTGTTRENWMHDKASSFYAISEAEKILPAEEGGKSKYEQAGFCRPVNLASEIARIETYMSRKDVCPAGPKADGP